jgi:hypothetical protein
VPVPTWLRALSEQLRRQPPAGVWLPALTAILILLGGLVFALFRPTTYQSTVELVLVPAPRQQDDLASLLSSVERSGTIGTYVELITSSDTLQAAGDPPVDVSVRAVPASRVITVTAKGDRAVVARAVEAVVDATQRRSSDLGDLWRLRRLQRASQPVAEAPTKPTIIGAVLLLSILGGLFVFVVVTRLAVRVEREPRGAAVPEQPGFDGPSKVKRSRSRARGR